MARKKEAGIEKELNLPKSVTAIANGNILTIKGPKGEAKRLFNDDTIKVKIEDSKITFISRKDQKINRKMIGSLVAHTKNMIKGSLENHVYTLKICSGHFPMNVAITGNKLVVKNFLGEKVPRELSLKAGAEVKVNGDHVTVSSASKEIAGQISADIEQLTRRPGFDTRVFQDGIYIINKDGKELK